MKPVNNTQSRFKNSPVAVTILQRVTFVSYTVARCKIWNVARLYGLRVTSRGTATIEEKLLAVVRGRWIPISKPLIDFHPSIPRPIDRSLQGVAAWRMIDSNYSISVKCSYYYSFELEIKEMFQIRFFL